MRDVRKIVTLLTLILALSLLSLALSCGGTEEVEVTRVVTQVVQETVPVEVTREVVVTQEVVVTATPEPGQPEVEVPFLERWANSPHNDTEAEAFNHWNEDDPAEIPTRCAKCHSTPGYRDYMGVDGTAFGEVNNAAEIGTTVQCTACHNETTLRLTSVVMPSGIELTGLGDEARCMVCHQGRSSTADVNSAIEEAGVDVDTVSEDLGFINIHYFAAAATKYGTRAKGGYEYEGMSYDANFAHVEEFDACIECHDMHTLELRVDECAECHTGVSEAEDFSEVRMAGSQVDYDGDGDLEEGIAHEIEGLQAMLSQAIQAYASEVPGTAIVYDAHSYPYFFIDTNENGEADEDEAAFPNQYNAWTPRLVRAAYNYQVSAKDPGTFAHGGKYIIQLLYDSIEDLNQAISEPVDLSEANRVDAGHFAGSEEAFRHWDEDGEVPGSCSKCHSAGGLPTFLEEGVTVSQPLANGFQCRTCHDSLTEFTRYAVSEVEFPSGAVLSFGEESDSNLCAQCHQGRQSTDSVNAAIEGLDDDTVAEDLGFLNVHYFAAGATRFGGEARGAYQYEGKEYVGLFEHVEAFSDCTQCHTTHGLQVRVQACAGCHPEAESDEELTAIRMTDTDFDGDGDTDEGIAGEIQTMHDALFAAIQDYAANVVGTPIVYDAHSYPYFFTDTNESGEPDDDETNYGNRYQSWTPRLLRAAYNDQYVHKDPGAFAHNGLYIIQVLYDGLEDMSAAVDVDMSGMVRP